MKFILGFLIVFNQIMNHNSVVENIIGSHNSIKKYFKMDKKKKKAALPLGAHGTKTKKNFHSLPQPLIQVIFPSTFPSLNATTTDSVAQVLKLGSYLCLFFSVQYLILNSSTFISLQSTAVHLHCCPPIQLTISSLGLFQWPL